MSRRNPPGQTGERVRVNIAHFREARGMTMLGLSERLKQLGRPIPPLGISRLENGDRRVDVDDLMALAEALDLPYQRILGGGSECTTCYGASPAGFVCRTCGSGA